MPGSRKNPPPPPPLPPFASSPLSRWVGSATPLPASMQMSSAAAVGLGGPAARRRAETPTMDGWALWHGALRPCME